MGGLLSKNDPVSWVIMVVGIPWISFALNLFIHTGWICQCCSPLIELGHIFKWFINNVYIVTWSCILFTRYELIYCSISIYLPADRIARAELGGTRWRTGGEVKGKLANGVVSQYSHATSERGISSITQADAHTSAASNRLNWHPHRFKWTRPFQGKTKSGFCACAITFRTSYTSGIKSSVFSSLKLHVFAQYIRAPSL